jgi:hypothetical protein
MVRGRRSYGIRVRLSADSRNLLREHPPLHAKGVFGFLVARMGGSSDGNEQLERIHNQGHVRWPYGEYRVTPGFVWVASSYNPWSFDSRYFGSLPVGIIRRRLKPFLTL